MSQPADEKLSLKGAWLGSHDHFLPRDATGIASKRHDDGAAISDIGPLKRERRTLVINNLDCLATTLACCSH